MPSVLDQIQSHLESQGYEVEFDGQTIKARHQSANKSNILIAEQKYGLLLCSNRIFVFQLS